MPSGRRGPSERPVLALLLLVPLAQAVRLLSSAQRRSLTEGDTGGGGGDEGADDATATAAGTGKDWCLLE
eukprot:SAG31_NODE_314_length_17854_cov_3.932075_11_plen_70_part_00